MQVYQSWARMEEQHGDYHSTNNVYSRAAIAFQDEWNILVRWAQLQVKDNRYDRARTLFELACDRVGSKNAEPYRLYAEFEMSLGNHLRARSIFFRGAQSLSESPDGAIGNNEELARLYHSWAICEWHLDNPDRTEVLFDHSLRMMDSGEDGSESRSLVMFSIARFLFHARQDQSLAQHCVCLSLTESIMPGGSSKIWRLWSKIADAMNNDHLKKECLEQVEKLRQAEKVSDISRVLEMDMSSKSIRRRGGVSSSSSTSSSSSMAGPAKRLLRRTPWYLKIYNSEADTQSWYNGIIFPDATATSSSTTLSSSGGSSQTSLEENKVVESKHDDKCFG